MTFAKSLDTFKKWREALFSFKDVFLILGVVGISSTTPYFVHGLVIALFLPFIFHLSFVFIEWAKKIYYSGKPIRIFKKFAKENGLFSTHQYVLRNILESKHLEKRIWVIDDDGPIDPEGEMFAIPALNDFCKLGIIKGRNISNHEGTMFIITFAQQTKTWLKNNKKLIDRYSCEDITSV